MSYDTLPDVGTRPPDLDGQLELPGMCPKDVSETFHLEKPRWKVSDTGIGHAALDQALCIPDLPRTGQCRWRHYRVRPGDTSGKGSWVKCNTWACDPCRVHRAHQEGRGLAESWLGQTLRVGFARDGKAMAALAKAVVRARRTSNYPEDDPRYPDYRAIRTSRSVQERYVFTNITVDVQGCDLSPIDSQTALNQFVETLAEGPVYQVSNPKQTNWPNRETIRFGSDPDEIKAIHAALRQEGFRVYPDGDTGNDIIEYPDGMSRQEATARMKAIRDAVQDALASPQYLDDEPADRPSATCDECGMALDNAMSIKTGRCYHCRIKANSNE